MIEQLMTLLPSLKKKSEADMSKITQPIMFVGYDMYKKKLLAPQSTQSETTEADGLSAGIAQTRQQESNFREFHSVKFQEADTEKSSDPYKFKVTLIQEGLGNLRDCFFYTKQSLESAVEEFEGKKCYADHPSKTDEINRPERSVREIVGYFENVHIENAPDKSALLVADLVMLKDDSNKWARTLVKEAVEFSQKHTDKNLIGLSINASGDAEAVDAKQFMAEGKVPDSAKEKMMDAINQGITTFRIVSTIKDAVSTDLVTEAGAKGKVMEIIESKKEGKSTMDDMKKKKMPIAPQQNEDEAKQADMPKDHADEEQDKALIMDMIKKYMGDDEMKDEEECKQAHEAYQAFKQMGYENEKAAESVGHALKLAKHMAGKQSESEKHEAEMEKHESEAEMEKKESESEDEKKEDESKKESAIVKLTARIAFLERELKKGDLAKFLDKKLAESKLGRAETDKLRKLIGEPKSEGEINRVIDLFMEGYKASNGSESKKPASKFFIESVTKTAPKASTGKKVDLSDAFK